MGVPVVCPSKTPERMRIVSGSWRCVTKADWPGRRRSRKGWISASVSGMRGGQPSTVQPMAGPCDSPQVVTRNRWPKLLWDTGSDRADIRRVRVLHPHHVIAAVHVVHLPGHPGREVAEQV